MTREQLYLMQVEEDFRSCGFDGDELVEKVEGWRKAILPPTQVVAPPSSTEPKGTEE